MDDWTDMKADTDGRMGNWTHSQVDRHMNWQTDGEVDKDIDRQSDSS